MQAGVVDGVLEATATLTNFVPQLGVIDLPYLAKDQTAAFRLFDGPVFEQELAGPPRQPAFMSCRSGRSRSATSTRAAEGDQQRGRLEGSEDRVIPSPSYIALFRALGAAPTPMAFGEIYTALQQGVIDGAENDAVTYITSKHMEVARNLAITST